MTVGLIVAAASSHSGKTTVSLGLIVALRARGLRVAAAKCGPDYLDPKFLDAASGGTAINLDPWAMGHGVHGRLARQGENADLVLVEGVMGLYDGGLGGAGSTASLARLTGLPVLLVVAAQGLAQSAAAIAEGFARLADGFGVAGAIVNQIASDRHADLVREGFARASVPLLGLLRRDPALALPSRHLGLVQAEEHADLAAKIAVAGQRIADGCDLDRVLAAAALLPPPLRGRVGEGGRPQAQTLSASPNICASREEEQNASAAPSRFPPPYPPPQGRREWPSLVAPPHPNPPPQGGRERQPPPPMPHSYVAPEQRDNAKRLRGDQTPAERVLWQELRAHRLDGLAFRRQAPIGSFIADFVCQAARLVVEVDGEAHRERGAYDRERDAALTAKGYRTLRVSNEDVLSRPEAVLDKVKRAAAASLPPPVRRRAGEGGRQQAPTSSDSPLAGDCGGEKNASTELSRFPPPYPPPQGGRERPSPVASSLPYPPPQGGREYLPPLGQRIAVARDVTFAFAYPHLLQDWRDQGAQISFFSPLGDEAPDPHADAVFLPGGYPELHAGALSAAETFRAGMAAATARGALIYGECGGYMVLGEALIDAEGASYPMLGLLPLVTSFRPPKLHLGYRRLRPLGNLPWTGLLAAHEFHFATIVSEGAAERLFEAADAAGEALGPIGLRLGRAMGSFAHVIDIFVRSPDGAPA